MPAADERKISTMVAETDLERLRRHIQEDKAVISRQQKILAALEASGQSTVQAKQLLMHLEFTLREVYARLKLLTIGKS